jgi:hypothetical protein
MNVFLIQLAVNLLTQAIPIGLAIYLGIRFAIAHGEISIRKKRGGHQSIEERG